MKPNDNRLEVYRCDYCEPGRACGIDGENTLDCSYDECHHPLDLGFAEEVVRRWNYVEELERLAKAKGA